MKKYFNNADARNTDNADIFMFIHNADKHCDDFIRIALDEEHMLLNYKGEQEFEIDNAMVFLRDSEVVMRYDFYPDDDDSYFYAAIDEKNGIAFRLSNSESDIEGYNTFGTNARFFGLFMTEDGTIFITYDGTMDRIGYSYLTEMPDTPRVMDQMEQLFNLFRPCDEDEDSDDDEEDDE